ncbi:hypothetical protein BV898_09909 [Hypsibius exemplaris]|uniref:Uncharacterized protein n=1 Tax=Hypsibius exemplaris TaxID=2072580 RepID=A0A1W0WLA5_HYPEX|nr:hypothetical protein BV898_09909 [Hypsibius exemplaris]
MPMNGQYNLVMRCDYPPDVTRHRHASPKHSRPGRDDRLQPDQAEGHRNGVRVVGGTEGRTLAEAALSGDIKRSCLLLLRLLSCSDFIREQDFVIRDLRADADLQQKDVKIAQQAAQIAELQRFIREQDFVIRDLRADVRTLTARIGAQEELIDGYKKAGNVAAFGYLQQREVTVLRALVRTLTARIGAQEELIDGYKKAGNVAAFGYLQQREVTVLRALFDNYVKDSTRVLDDQARKHSSAWSLVKELEERVEGLEEKKSNLQMRVKGLEEEKSNLQMRVEGLEEEKSNLQMRVKGLEMNQTELQEQLKASVKNEKLPQDGEITAAAAVVTKVFAC